MKGQSISPRILESCSDGVLDERLSISSFERELKDFDANSLSAYYLLL